MDIRCKGHRLTLVLFWSHWIPSCCVYIKWKSPSGMWSAVRQSNWFLSWSAQPGMRAPCPGEHQQRASTAQRGSECRLIFLSFCQALFVLIMLILFPTVLLLTDLIASDVDRCYAYFERNSDRERDYNPSELWLKLSEPRSLCLLLETLIQVLPGLCVQAAGHKHRQLSQVCQPYQSDLDSES